MKKMLLICVAIMMVGALVLAQAPAPTATPKADAAKTEVKKDDAAKPATAMPVASPKADAAKPAVSPKADAAKPAVSPKADAAKPEVKKDEAAKPATTPAPKADEAK